MTDEKHVFISYSTKDATFVGRMREDLERQNIPYWIDKEGLRPGTPNWEKGIRKAIKDAFATVYVVTPDSYTSEFVQGEIAIAEMEGATIYPIWANGDKWHECVPIDKVKTQYIDMREDKYVVNRQELFNALRTKRPDLAIKPTVPAAVPAGVVPRNPYKGLNAFTERDVADFFGRDALVNELFEAVKVRVADNKDHILTIIGASGSGKSSAVMAGLLPKLKLDKSLGSDQWTYLKPMVPGDHPVQSLANVLYSAPGRSLSNKVIDEDLSHPNGLGLLTTVETLSKKLVVLYIDQFEELFMTDVPEEERQQFISLLTDAVTQPDSPVFVLLTLRADFYDRPMSDAVLGRLVQSYNRSVLPMSITDLRDTVEKPAAASGLTFEPGLVADIIFDVRDDKGAQAGALPLLQYTLEQLYDHRNGNTLTAAAYQDIGGVKGAIGAHAEEVFRSLDIEAQNAFARVFQALVHVDERGTSIRRRATETSLISQPAAARLTDALIRKARVLRVDTDRTGDIPYVEVAHEALLTSWQRLADWTKSADSDLRIIQEMKDATLRWVNEGRPKHRLWVHELQISLYAALERLPQALTTDEQLFIRPESERLFDEFVNAREHIQLTIVERDFTRIGVSAVPMMVNAYGYGKGNQQVQNSIISQLKQHPQKTISSIQISLSNSDSIIRKGAIDLCGKLRIKEMINYVTLATNDIDNEVRCEAVKTLGQMGNPIAVPNLLIALNDTHKNVRKAAIEAVAKIQGIGALSDLHFALKDSEWEVRQEAVIALGTLRDSRVLSYLISALNDEKENVRQMAAITLGTLRDSNALPDLLVTATSDENNEVRQAANIALKQLNNVIPYLRTALENKRWQVRQAAIITLGQLGDVQALPDILIALDDKEIQVKQAALLAIKMLGTPLQDFVSALEIDKINPNKR